VPFVGRGAGKPDIVELDLADVKNMKFLDHVFLPGLIPKELCLGVNTIRDTACLLEYGPKSGYRFFA
jgi:hypothetical protein